MEPDDPNEGNQANRARAAFGHLRRGRDPPRQHSTENRNAGAKIPGTRREAYKIRAYRFYTRTENLSARMREPEHPAGSPARCGARGLRRTGAGLACWDGRRSLR
jgi:hypothetical protein